MGRFLELLVKLKEVNNAYFTNSELCPIGDQLLFMYSFLIINCPLHSSIFDNNCEDCIKNTIQMLVDTDLRTRKDSWITSEYSDVILEYNPELYKFLTAVGFIGINIQGA